MDIHDASLYIGNGSVKAKGQYGIDSGEFSIGGTIHNAEIAPFTQNLSTPASGIVNGEFSVKGKNSDITSIEGNIVGTSLSVRGISIDSARVSFNNVGALTNIAVTGAIGNGQLSGYGTIDNNLLNLSLSADSLDASNFQVLLVIVYLAILQAMLLLQEI